MAISKKNTTVLLGYEDELVTDKHKSILGYWINKIGGCPDWPVDGISSPTCRLCGLPQPLVAQIYAPLENSMFHRTLYIFTCINPNCWNYSESWTCIRSQLLDQEASASNATNSEFEWCSGASNWDDDNGNFSNGNTIKGVSKCNSSDNDSEDDSSSLSARIGSLNVNECNANWDNLEVSSGAVGKQISPVASAEIEKEESEVVSIDTPTAPQKDLISLLQETAPVPYFMRSGERNLNKSIYFTSFFISVGEEASTVCSSDHIRELIQEYQRNHGDLLCQGTQARERGDENSEEYEKGLPAHGDKMFHHFLSKLQSNPGQLLRYSRESSSPLLLYPLQEYPRKCQYCNCDMVFEMQLLPTLISKLHFPDEEETRVEFGTVLIFTCQQSCWSDDKFREEVVVVQMEKT